METKRIAIVGGGIAGVTAAWQLAKLASSGADVEVVLFEATPRLGGIVETVHSSGFTIECGPDAWVTEKPWARELAVELGLESEIMPSNDATRKTYVFIDGKLIAMPDGMRMMVPRDLAALDASSLFSESAKSAFRVEITRAEELKVAAPSHDESVSDFVLRHFGLEVLEKIGAPLLGGVFGGDVTKLSVRAVMAPFVQMEREHGSLIAALQQRPASSASIFTTLRTGMGTLLDTMIADIPPSWLRLETPVTSIRRTNQGWEVHTGTAFESFDSLLLATPAHISRALLEPINPSAAALMQMDASSAVVAGFAFTDHIELPAGFGFLVPPGSTKSSLLAGTFVDQKFNHRVPPHGRLLRGFFGGATADKLLNQTDEHISALALSELAAILGPLPTPIFTVVRRWPNALPQYAVGHIERMSELSRHVQSIGNLWLLGNGYHGVGLPDLVRDSRSAAWRAVSSVEQGI